MTTPETTTPAKAAKKAPKMVQTPKDDGSVEFAFNAPEGEAAIAAQTYKLDDFPQNVRDFFAIFGMRTKLRNFTVPDAGETEASAGKMAEKLSKGASLLKQGLLRIAREPGEKKAGGTLLLEAAILYRAKKAAAKGEPFEATDEAVAQIAGELEALTEEQLEQLKATTLFKLATAEAKERRASAKRAELEAQAAKEAAEAA